MGAPRPSLIFADNVPRSAAKILLGTRTEHIITQPRPRITYCFRLAVVVWALCSSWAGTIISDVNRCWVFLLQLLLTVVWVAILNHHLQFLFLQSSTKTLHTHPVPTHLIIPFFRGAWPCPSQPQHPGLCHYVNPPPPLHHPQQPAEMKRLGRVETAGLQWLTHSLTFYMFTLHRSSPCATHALVCGLPKLMHLTFFLFPPQPPGSNTPSSLSCLQCYSRLRSDSSGCVAPPSLC